MAHYCPTGCHSKTPGKSYLRKEGSWFEGPVHHSDPSMRQLLMLHPQPGSRDWWMLALSELSPFYAVWDPWSRDGAIHISGDSPPSVNDWRTWRFLSKVIPDPIKCAININRHTWSYYVALFGFELTAILLPHTPECWAYGHVPQT